MEETKKDAQTDEHMFEKPIEDIGEQKGCSKLSKKHIIIIVIASVIVVAAAITIPLVLLLKKKHKPEPEPEPEPEDLDFTEEGHRNLSRCFATQGMILATNKGNSLPLQPTDRVVLFGMGTNATRYGGGGSGEVYEKGTTHSIVPIHVLEGMQNRSDRFHYVENDIGYELGSTNLTEDDIKKFAEKEEGDKRSVAVMTISRFSSEGGDRQMDDSDVGTQFTDREMRTYNSLRDNFDNVVVVLNVPSVMELQGIEAHEQTSILISLYPGCEAGNAIALVLVGDVNPSGHLTDTWAKTINDYPTTATFIESVDYVKYTEGIFVGYRYFELDEEKQKLVVFPFGYGLSYTTFDVSSKCTFDKKTEEFTVKSTVKNTGNRSGKQVVQVYAQKPKNDQLPKAPRELVAFSKTSELEPGKSEVLTMHFKLKDLASYDENGVTGNKACYVLEPGDYNVYAGTNVAETRGDSNKIYTHNIKELIVTERLHTRLQPKDPDVKEKGININHNLQSKETLMNFVNVDKVPEDICEKETFELKAPDDDYEKQDQIMLPTTHIAEINFKTVIEKKHTMEELVDTMTNEELAFLTFGHTASIQSYSGSMGGFYNSDITGQYLIPNAETTDGPAGIRQWSWQMQSVAWPCASLLASTFDPSILEEVGKETGKEARRVNSSIWLSPAMNLHRSPLCGRNFEYYSEDPLVIGKMASGIARGLQSKRVSCTLKHFAANDKEENRNGDKGEGNLASDSRMSERTAREIYLKGFQIAVKEGKPWSIMSSYNRLNGMKTGESYDLLTGILRNEWGYEGMVMTDWGSNSRIAREILAGNNVKMNGNPGGVQEVLDGLRNGMFTREQLKKCVIPTLNMIAKTAAIDALFNTSVKEVVLNTTEKTRIKISEVIYSKSPGIYFEQCLDEDGGYNPSYTTHNSWATIRINNEKEDGYHKARIRYSGNLEGFGVTFKKDDEYLGSISNLDATGGWQNWITSPDFGLYLPKGKYQMTLLFLGYDYGDEDKDKGNINWLEIDP